MPDDYDLYVSSSLYWNAHDDRLPEPDAWSMGSNLLQQLGPGEQRVVLAHELGHILSDHVLYMTGAEHPARGRRRPAAGSGCRCARCARCCWSGSAPPS